MRATVLATLVLVTACSPDTGERFVAEAEGFSLIQPEGWTLQRDRDALVLSSSKQARRSLAIRSVPVADARASQNALASTRTVVEALPDAKVIATRSIDGVLHGVSYELTFSPPGAQGRYARTHVVLVGEHHVFHVIETVPVGERIRDGVMSSVVASFREEV